MGKNSLSSSVIHLHSRMLKSKRKKDDATQSPSKMALSSDYDHDQAVNAEEGLSLSERKSWGSRSSSRQDKASSAANKRTKKPDEVSIKMPSTPKAKKTTTSRFSLRGLILNNPLFPPPFGQSSSPRIKSKSKDTGGPSSSTANATAASDFDTRSLWRDNASACSQGGQSQAGSNAVRECPLCLAECTLDQFPHLSNCPHLFCMECLHTYTKLEIQEGRVNLKCPQCTELVHPNGKNANCLYFSN